MENYHINVEEFKEIAKIFSKIFSKTELECIKIISIFISLIYPNKKDENDINSEEISEFKKFIYRLSILLLGYNLYKMNDFSSISGSKEYLCAKNLFLIIELFIFYYLDKDEDTKVDKKNENVDFLNDYLDMKRKINENIYNDNNHLLLFIKTKNNINLKSIKYLM